MDDGWFDRVRANIERSGHHITVVGGGVYPRFAYTIGRYDRDGYEWVIAGAEATLAIPDLGALLNAEAPALETQPVDPSWAALLLLGVAHHHERDDVPARQLLPAPWTIDVPDLSQPFDPIAEPVWRCLTAPWPYDVRGESRVATDMGVLTGAPVHRAARFEEDYWEIFSEAGPDAEAGPILVPLATVLTSDDDLWWIAELDIGQGRSL